MRKNLTMERVMKKLLTLLTLTIVLLSFGCKKDAEQTATPKDNQTDNQTQAPLTDMEPFKKSLSILKNPQYDLLYKLIEKGGVNAQLEEDVTIGYPSHAKRLLINEPQITIQKGATPLGIAALFCTPSLVNDLIEKGADLKAKTNGMEVSAIIIQCGEAEQAGMFENYLKAARKFERDNPSIYKDKSELYAANAIIKDNITDEDGKGKTILNYAVENNLNDAIPVIIKYAGGINFTNRNDENNDQMPVITALKSKNFEALNFFFTKTASLYADMKAEDGTNTIPLHYMFYNDMGPLLQEANVPVDVFMNLVLRKYSQDGAGIEAIKNIVNGGSITTMIEEITIQTKDDNVTIGHMSNIAHIAATFEYNYLLRGLALMPNSLEVLTATNDAGETPLAIAKARGHNSTVKALGEAGVDIFGSYEENDAVPYIYGAKQIFNSIEGGSKLSRLLGGGVNNKLPFAVEVNGVTIPKDATPLIAAALLCNSEAVDALILAKADTDIRIKGENDLKYNAYDFADRMAQGDCTAVKASLKNPASVKPNQQMIDDYLNRSEDSNVSSSSGLPASQESTETVIDENTTVEETPADNTDSESDADVELVIEEETAE